MKNLISLEELEKVLVGTPIKTVKGDPNKFDPQDYNALITMAGMYSQSYRILTPNVVITADWKPDRLNIHLEKGENETWKIIRLTLG